MDHRGAGHLSHERVSLVLNQLPRAETLLTSAPHSAPLAASPHQPPAPVQAHTPAFQEARQSRSGRPPHSGDERSLSATYEKAVTTSGTSSNSAQIQDPSELQRTLQRALVFGVLDASGDSVIQPEEFSKLCYILHLRFRRKVCRYVVSEHRWHAVCLDW